MIKSLLRDLRYPMMAIFVIMASGCHEEKGPVDFARYNGAAADRAVEEADTVAFASTDSRLSASEDRPNRMAKQAALKATASRESIELDSLVVPVKMVKKGSPIKSEPPLSPVRHTRTKLVEFESAPFPYHGLNPNTGRPFLDVVEGGRRGHRASGGEVYWENKTYSDSRVLLHIPRGFDVRRPSLMVVFLHGHGATLQRDVIERQRVPEQVSLSGVNAVLVAPQLASDAADSSAGKLWEPGGFQNFLDEASVDLAKVHGDPRSKAYFARMPVVIVAYSGGYMTAASCIRQGGAGKRVRGIVLLDALYGEMDTFAEWISAREKRFFLSAYANSTRARNTELAALLQQHNVPVTMKLKGPLRSGSVTFVSTAPETEHRDFVTKAWASYPLKDILQRLRVEAK